MEGKPLCLVHSDQAAQAKQRSKTARPALFDPAVILRDDGQWPSHVHAFEERCHFCQGDDADSVSISGRARSKSPSYPSRARKAVIALLGPDEFVGEGCLIGQPKRLATASAMSECETMRVAKTEIQRVLDDEPTFSQMFVTHIFGEERPGRRRLSRSAF